MTMSEIPGLTAITDEPTENGGCKITLHIEDDKVDEFFRAFGLRPDDEAGVQALVIQAIEEYLVAQGHSINRPA